MLSSLTKEGSNDIKGPSCEQKQGNKTHNRGTKQFFLNISKCEGKPAILSLIEPYNELFVAQEVALPNPLTKQLFKEEYMKLGFESLLSKGKEITIDINKEQCLLIESSTREQSNSRIWYQQRAGRITASKLKSVCHTKVEKPSQSLIKSICYPELHKFSNDATKWGMKYEDVARKAYVGEITEAGSCKGEKIYIWSCNHNKIPAP